MIDKWGATASLLLMGLEDGRPWFQCLLVIFNWCLTSSVTCEWQLFGGPAVQRDHLKHSCLMPVLCGSAPHPIPTWNAIRLFGKDKWSSPVGLYEGRLALFWPSPLFETEDYCEMTNQIFSGNIQPVNPFYISRHSFQAICQTGNWKALIFFCSTILMEHSSKGDATALWWSICMSSSHSWTFPQASQNSSLLQVISTLAIFSFFTIAPGTQPGTPMDSDSRSTILHHCRLIRIRRGAGEEVEHPLILIQR